LDEKGENKQQGLGVSQSRAVLSTNTISKTNVSVKNKTGTVTTENKPLASGAEEKHCYRHADFESELAEFPESYHQALIQLHNKHIEWRFEAVKTGKDWEKFITAQALVDKYGGSKSLTSSAYTNWHLPGGKSQQGGWYPVKKEVAAYFVDPRNFISSEKDIFQFLKLDGYDANSQTLEGVKKILENTKLLSFADAFIKAAIEADVNVYYLASKCKLETGGGTCSLFKGTVEDMTVTTEKGKKITFENKGYYNAYNIRAFATKEDLNVYKLSQTQSINKNGAQFAKEKKWTTQEKAIIGGAKWCKDQYIAIGQDTMYANKFDYESNTPWHQYVQNIEAAYHEAVKYHTAYNHISKLDEKLIFKIPVYDNMPAEPIKLLNKK
jgi:beta-N-acetylglucosaminidase